MMVSVISVEQLPFGPARGYELKVVSPEEIAQPASTHE
jgi:hypothetical protein